MAWTDNEIILHQRSTMPSADLFQAVCDEIGKHYIPKGFKYSRSRPKISLKDKQIKLEITFWSSRSNIPGRHINLEILPNFYSVELAKANKTKGFLFGHTAIFSHKYSENPKLQQVISIFGDVMEREVEYTRESEIRYYNSCNIYDINEFKFKRILEFIDEKIIPWFDKLKTIDGVLELTENPSRRVIWSLNGKSSNSEFIEYCRLKFSGLSMEKRLDEKNNPA